MRLYEPLLLPRVSALPIAASLGRMYVLTTDGHVYQENGVVWDDLSAAGSIPNAIGDVLGTGNGTKVVVNDAAERVFVTGSMTTTGGLVVGGGLSVNGDLSLAAYAAPEGTLNMLIVDDAGLFDRAAIPGADNTTLASTNANNLYPTGSYQFNVTTSDGYVVNGRLTGTRNGTDNVQRLQSWSTGVTYSRFWNNSTSSWTDWEAYTDIGLSIVMSSGAYTN